SRLPAAPRHADQRPHQILPNNIVVWISRKGLPVKSERRVIVSGAGALYCLGVQLGGAFLSRLAGELSADPRPQASTQAMWRVESTRRRGAVTPVAIVHALACEIVLGCCRRRRQQEEDRGKREANGLEQLKSPLR